MPSAILGSKALKSVIRLRSRHTFMSTLRQWQRRRSMCLAMAMDNSPCELRCCLYSHDYHYAHHHRSVNALVKYSLPSPSVYIIRDTFLMTLDCCCCVYVFLRCSFCDPFTLSALSYSLLLSSHPIPPSFPAFSIHISHRSHSTLSM